MIDAARLDGCGEFGIYLRVVMPLVRPMAAAFCLVCFLGQLECLSLRPMYSLHSQDKLTLPVVLNLYLGEFRQDQGVFLAGTTLAMIPPAVLFLRLAKGIHQRADLGRSQGVECFSTTESTEFTEPGEDGLRILDPSSFCFRSLCVLRGLCVVKSASDILGSQLYAHA
jgi:hypothetical protein